MSYNELHTENAVNTLVKELVNGQRRRTIAVISTPNRSAEPVIDARRLAEETARIADVYVVPTGRLTFFMGDLMKPNTHVYGGAGRIYPPGNGWQQDLRKAPLRLAYSPMDAPATTDQLIKDAFRAAGMNQPADQHLRTSESDAPARAEGQRTLTVVRDAPSTGQNGSLSLPDVLLDLANAQTQIDRLREKVSVAEVLVALQDSQLADVREAEVLTRNAYTEQLRVLRTKLAKTRSEEPAGASYADLVSLYPTADEAVRHSIRLAWVLRTPSSEKTDNPLPDYLIGDRFASSLGKLDQGQVTKSIRCALDVLTGAAREMPSRRMHVLRNGDGAGAPAVTRLDDAVCWRVNVETGAASARRLHYWKLPNGKLELSRVVLHDDMSP